MLSLDGPCSVRKIGLGDSAWTACKDSILLLNVGNGYAKGASWPSLGVRNRALLRSPMDNNTFSRDIRLVIVILEAQRRTKVGNPIGGHRRVSVLGTKSMSADALPVGSFQPHVQLHPLKGLCTPQ